MAAGHVVTANGGLCKTQLYVQQPMKLEASSVRAVSSHMKKIILVILKALIVKKEEKKLYIIIAALIFY